MGGRSTDGQKKECQASCSSGHFEAGLCKWTPRRYTNVEVKLDSRAASTKFLQGGKPGHDLVNRKCGSNSSSNEIRVESSTDQTSPVNTEEGASKSSSLTSNLQEYNRTQ